MITSTHNQHVAFCRSLHRSRPRREAKAFLVEGVRLAHEGLDAEVELELALYDPAVLTGSDAGAELLSRLTGMDHAYEASAAAIAAAAETRTPQGVVLVAREPDPPPPESIVDQHLLLVLDGISDAGNAGTILRSAAAAGLGVVVFAGDTVDPWLGKVVRAGMGAHFRIGIVQATWEDLASRIARFDQVLAAEAAADITIYDVEWSRTTALIIGSEAHGLAPEAKALEPGRVRISMAAGMESLNAAAAAAVILFHAAHSAACPV